MCARKHQFNERQLEILKHSPFTANVTQTGIVHFTKEFKEMAYKKFLNGEKPSKIMEEAGFGECFKPSDNAAIFEHIRKEAGSPKGFREVAKNKEFEAKRLERMEYQNAIRELQQEIIQLKEEIDFIKKILIMGDFSE